ncbi:hypothetical protein [Sinorhizobium terangae]|uniref:Uncharacterized protein n=1 Tax=Sinorhizobium terangae TaxID=110322 RepID=A0A6N7LI89_SINTE|nr:hypothetical protein [Sinorhizobium terangae]MBB4185717.1 hypothetical protein [Sinorhizobium terangae]MQX17583.1 hypothetical protein [Sinorhizobium terangae]WFU46226.1 hypothetical protein QA637_09895 [Sinorhizobium terangae]
MSSILRLWGVRGRAALQKRHNLGLHVEAKVLIFAQQFLPQRILVPQAFDGSRGKSVGFEQIFHLLVFDGPKLLSVTW